MPLVLLAPVPAAQEVIPALGQAGRTPGQTAHRHRTLDSPASGSGSTGPHSSSPVTSARSNIRATNTASEHVNNVSANFASRSGSSFTSGAASGLSQADIASLQEPIQLHHESGNMNKALREGKFDADLREFGLESNKETYKAKLAAIGESDKTLVDKKPSWFARAFVNRTEKDDHADARRPCKGKNCKPVPPPPGPHPNPPQITNGNPEFCWGYIERCDRRGNCYAHLRPVNGSYRSALRSQLVRSEQQADISELNKIATCVTASQSAECESQIKLTQDAEYEVAQLRKQYTMCLRAAGSLADLQNVWP